MIFIYKPAGVTPLQALTQWKLSHPEYLDQTVSYAGRLDPMAEGLLLLLVGTDNKDRRQFEKLPKVYEFEIIPGIATDTSDVMGYITSPSTTPVTLPIEEFDQTLQHLVGSLTLPYPDYSAKYVDGHPLYWYARRNLLDTIERPQQTVQITKLARIATEPILASTMLASITRRLDTVEGDFRQSEIRSSWHDILENSEASYQLIRCTLSCGSGTYVRGIVTHLSTLMKQPLLTYSIKRTEIGSHTLAEVDYR